MGWYFWHISRIINSMKNRFRIIAGRVSNWTGSAYTFTAAFLVVIIWAVSGPIFQFSDTWQLVINTGTTIVTFLMVFLIQNTQNRDSKALQLKLDELIRSTKGARLHYISLEDLEDDELEELDREFKVVAHNPGSLRSIRKLHEKIKDANSQRKTSRLTFYRHLGAQAEISTEQRPQTPPANNS